MTRGFLGTRRTPHVARVTGGEQLGIARALFEEYAASLEVDLEYQGFEAEVAGLPGAYAPPDGCLLLAWVRAAPAGCVGVRRLGPRQCELKRLFVRPIHRGLGLGVLLVGAAIAGARDLGYEEMRLDTLPTMVEAQTLYRRLGFRDIPPYGTDWAPGSRFYGLRLVA